MYTTCSAKVRASDKDLPVAKDSSMPTQKERSLASSAATSTSPTPSSKSSESSNISIHREKVQKDPNTLTIFARKGQFFYIQIHQGIFGPNCQFGSNFLFLLLVAGCLCRWGLFTDFFAIIKYVVNSLMSVG